MNSFSVFGLLAVLLALSVTGEETRITEETFETIRTGEGSNCNNYYGSHYRENEQSGSYRENGQGEFSQQNRQSEYYPNNDQLIQRTDRQGGLTGEQSFSPAEPEGYLVVHSGCVGTKGYYYSRNLCKKRKLWNEVTGGIIDGQNRFYLPANEQVEETISQGIMQGMLYGMEIVHDGWIDEQGHYYSYDSYEKQDSWEYIIGGIIDRQGRFYFRSNGQRSQDFSQSVWLAEQEGYQVVFSGWVDAKDYYHSRKSFEEQNSWNRVRGGIIDGHNRFYFPANEEVKRKISRRRMPTMLHSIEVVHDGWVDAQGYYHSQIENEGQNSWKAINEGIIDSRRRFYYRSNGLRSIAGIDTEAESGVNITAQAEINANREGSAKAKANIQKGTGAEYVVSASATSNGSGSAQAHASANFQGNHRKQPNHSGSPNNSAQLRSIANVQTDANGSGTIKADARGHVNSRADVSANATVHHNTDGEVNATAYVTVNNNSKNNGKDKSKENVNAPAKYNTNFKVVSSGWVDAKGYYHSSKFREEGSSWNHVPGGIIDGQNRFYLPANEQVEETISQGIMRGMLYGMEVVHDGWIDEQGHYYSYNSYVKQDSWDYIIGGIIDRQGRFYFRSNGQRSQDFSQSVWLAEQEGYQVVFSGWVDAEDYYHSRNSLKERNSRNRVLGGIVDGQNRFYSPANEEVTETLSEGVVPPMLHSIEVVHDGWVDVKGYYHLYETNKGQNSWKAINGGIIDSQKRFYYRINGQSQLTDDNANRKGSANADANIQTGTGAEYAATASATSSGFADAQAHASANYQGIDQVQPNDSRSPSKSTQLTSIANVQTDANGSGTIQAHARGHVNSRADVSANATVHHNTDGEVSATAQTTVNNNSKNNGKDKSKDNVNALAKYNTNFKVVSSGWVDAKGYYHSSKFREEGSSWNHVPGGIIDGQNRFYLPANEQVKKSFAQRKMPAIIHSMHVVDNGWVDAQGYHHSYETNNGQNSWKAINEGIIDSRRRFYYRSDGLRSIAEIDTEAESGVKVIAKATINANRKGSANADANIQTGTGAEYVVSASATSNGSGSAQAHASANFQGNHRKQPNHSGSPKRPAKIPGFPRRSWNQPYHNNDFSTGGYNNA